MSPFSLFCVGVVISHATHICLIPNSFPPLPHPVQPQGDNALIASAYITPEQLRDSVFYAGLWDRHLTLVMSEDFFHTIKVLRPCGNDFQTVYDGTIFLGVARGCTEPDDGGASVTLYSSKDSGKSWTEACFPVDESENGYMVYDVDRTVFVNVNHNESDDERMRGAPIGMVYHADADTCARPAVSALPCPCPFCPHGRGEPSAPDANWAPDAGSSAQHALAI